MTVIGPIGFLSPWLLTALLALPLIWWLLRFTPPLPKKIRFPATRLLKDLEDREKTPSKSPWWLTALRVILAACIILALAQPILNPESESAATNGETMVMIIDNGWASASDWQQRKTYVNQLVTRAERNNSAVVLMTTAPATGIQKVEPQAPARIKERLAGLSPLPYTPKRTDILTPLKVALKSSQSNTIYWISDGLDYGNASTFAGELAKIAGNKNRFNITKTGGENSPLGLNAVIDNSADLKVRIIRAKGGEQNGVVQAWTARSARLGETPFSFASDQKEILLTFDLPLELRNQVARIEIAGENSAGSVFLLDARAQRQRVGLISGESRETAQPLLSPIYYVERALSPYSLLITSKTSNIAAATDEILQQNPSTLIMTDIGKLVGKSFSAISDWTNNGGILIRFAGPRLERDADELLPVRLRQGGRTLGGALSWSEPQGLAPFENDSLFHGLTVADDITVNRQVLADPAYYNDAETQVWARLKDGTPLVTAAKRGKGWVILFHVTANSDWSKLPHSGLFVEMLRRLTTLTNVLVSAPVKTRQNTATENNNSASLKNDIRLSGPDLLQPFQTLNGFGMLGAPSTTAEPIKQSQLGNLSPGPKHPPGLYGPVSAARALNVLNDKSVLTLHPEFGDQATTLNINAAKAVSLKPWFLTAALALLLIDALAVIAIGGGLLSRQNLATSPIRASAAAIVTALLVGTVMAIATTSNLHAQERKQELRADRNDERALQAALKTRLAYVITGNQQIDNVSRNGLNGLSRIVAARTAVEPAEPFGIDVNRDELAFYPILYWPVPEDAKALPSETLSKIDAYMKQGGMIIFDTRDHQANTSFGLSGRQSAGTNALQRLLGKLDIPRLEPVPQGHVLTKTFYLLNSFPGRWDGGVTWVEAEDNDGEAGEKRARRSDGVSSIIVTSNDLAAAWALDDDNRPKYPVVPGGELQREMAFRTGINIVMYALTGNYKADQVHVPALLERLGQ